MSYADVNGISLYYEEHGSGQPLILLHGGLGSGDMYAPILPLLAKGRRVITVDLQAHGRTADIDRPLRYETLGDDVAGLIRHLGLAQADVMGTPSAPRPPCEPRSSIRTWCAAWWSRPSRAGGTGGTRRAGPGWTRWGPRWPGC
jgi:hypothetical protein